MTPKLTDTDKTLQAVRDAAEEGARDGAREAGTPTHGTHTPSRSGVTEERAYSIAERVHDRKNAERWLECETKGPASKLASRVDNHEGRIENMERAREREEGGRQLRTRVFAGLGVLGVLSGIASGWYGATHSKAQADTTVDVAAELQALRAELRRPHPQPVEPDK